MGDSNSIESPDDDSCSMASDEESASDEEFTIKFACPEKQSEITQIPGKTTNQSYACCGKDNQIDESSRKAISEELATKQMKTSWPEEQSKITRDQRRGANQVVAGCLVTRFNQHGSVALKDDVAGSIMSLKPNQKSSSCSDSRQPAIPASKHSRDSQMWNRIPANVKHTVVWPVDCDLRDGASGPEVSSLAKASRTSLDCKEPVVRCDLGRLKDVGCYHTENSVDRKSNDVRFGSSKGTQPSVQSHDYSRHSHEWTKTPTIMKPTVECVWPLTCDGDVRDDYSGQEVPSLATAGSANLDYKEPVVRCDLSRLKNVACYHTENSVGRKSSDVGLGSSSETQPSVQAHDYAGGSHKWTKTPTKMKQTVRCFLPMNRDSRDDNLGQEIPRLRKAGHVELNYYEQVVQCDLSQFKEVPYRKSSDVKVSSFSVSQPSASAGELSEDSGPEVRDCGRADCANSDHHEPVMQFDLSLFTKLSIRQKEPVVRCDLSSLRNQAGRQNGFDQVSAPCQGLVRCDLSSLRNQAERQNGFDQVSSPSQGLEDLRYQDFDADHQKSTNMLISPPTGRENTRKNVSKLRHNFKAFQHIEKKGVVGEGHAELSFQPPEEALDLAMELYDNHLSAEATSQEEHFSVTFITERLKKAPLIKKGIVGRGRVGLSFQPPPEVPVGLKMNLDDNHLSAEATSQEEHVSTFVDKPNMLNDAGSKQVWLTPPDHSFHKNHLCHPNQQNRQSQFQCNLPYNGHEEDKPHFERCIFVLASQLLKDDHTRWLESIPNADELVINSLLGSACRRLALEDFCPGECTHSHEINVNFDFPEHSSKITFIMFAKWFLMNAKQPNFRVLWQLLTHLPSHCGVRVLFMALSFSTVIFKLPQPFRRPLGIKLVAILVSAAHLDGVEAIRTLLLFNVSPSTSASNINELLKYFGILDKTPVGVYNAVSCVWHITDKYAFPVKVLVKILRDCLRLMPEDLNFTKEKIMADLMKCSRHDLLAQFHVLDQFLMKYFPQNSKQAYLVRTSVFYSVLPEIHENRYGSRRVKGFGPINWEWNYWDIKDCRRKSFEITLKKNSVVDENRVEFSFRAPPEEPLDLEMELLSEDLAAEAASQEKHVSSTSNSDVSSQIMLAIMRAQYSDLAEMILSYCEFSEEKVANDFLDIFRTVALTLDRTVTFSLIYEVFQAFEGQKSPAVDAFLCTANSLAVTFFKERDYKSTVKMLKSIRHCGMNPFAYLPKNCENLQTFSTIAAQSHFECRCYHEVMKILHYGNCFAYVRYIGVKTVAKHFNLFEGLVLRMMTVLLEQCLAKYAYLLFREIVISQQDLHSPIDISSFYEGVLLGAFIPSLKNPCPPHEGAILFVLVDRICGNNVLFGQTAYRTLLVELYRAHSPEDIIRRLLALMLELQVYPKFSLDAATIFGSHLAWEEMFLYLKHLFNFFAVKNAELLLQPFKIILRKTSSRERPYPVTNHVEELPSDLPAATERLKKALKELFGSLYDELYLNFDTPEEVTIPCDGMVTVQDVIKSSFL